MPRAVFYALLYAVRRVGVSFPVDSVLLVAGPGPHVVLAINLRTMDVLVTDSMLEIPGTHALFRGQPAADPRPNRALRLWLVLILLESRPPERHFTEWASPWKNSSA